MRLESRSRPSASAYGRVNRRALVSVGTTVRSTPDSNTTLTALRSLWALNSFMFPSGGKPPSQMTRTRGRISGCSASAEATLVSAPTARM